MVSVLCFTASVKTSVAFEVTKVKRSILTEEGWEVAWSRTILNPHMVGNEDKDLHWTLVVDGVKYRILDPRCTSRIIFGSNVIEEKRVRLAYTNPSAKLGEAFFTPGVTGFDPKHPVFKEGVTLDEWDQLVNSGAVLV